MNSSCVSAGGMGSVPISFSPTSRGEFRSEVLVASNGATNNPHRVRLFGIGADMTRPPVGRDGGTSDGGPTRRDGGGSGPGEVPSEYNGPQIDAACACRVPAAPARSTPSRTVALAALAALGAVAARARRRSH
jgi:MYXO-CTERM domain-containing protein